MYICPTKGQTKKTSIISGVIVVNFLSSEKHINRYKTMKSQLIHIDAHDYGVCNNCQILCYFILDFTISIVVSSLY